MSSGRPHRPLFDLIAERESPARRAHPATEPPVRNEAKPAADPAPEIPRAPSIPRIEVMASEGRGDARAGEPRVVPARPRLAWLGAARVALPINALYLAVAVVLGVMWVVWSVAYRMGESAGQVEAERRFGIPGPAAPADPLANAEPPAATPTRVESKPAPTQRTPARTAPAASTATTPEAPGNAAADRVLAGRGAFLTVGGRVESDPRQAGLNYLMLSIMEEREAAEAIAFLAERKFDAIAVPNRGDRRATSGKTTVVLVAMPGITGEEFSKNRPARTKLEQQAATLGDAWKKSRQGTSDFRQRYWVKQER